MDEYDYDTNPHPHPELLLLLKQPIGGGCSEQPGTSALNCQADFPDALLEVFLDRIRLTITKTFELPFSIIDRIEYDRRGDCILIHSTRDDLPSYFTIQTKSTAKLYRQLVKLHDTHEMPFYCAPMKSFAIPGAQRVQAAHPGTKIILIFLFVLVAVFIVSKFLQ
ncbi:MAG: hypothetical protein RIT04_390 [Candidatus Parcubacteria bacterium]|jgi:hypothetical protein